jgi:hypothetical protein
MLDSLHPESAMLLINRGLLLRDEALEREIGRVVRFHSWKPDMGTMRRDFTFKIVGVQLDYAGRHCWRVLCNDGFDSFGSVAHPSDFEFVD